MKYLKYVICIIIGIVICSIGVYAIELCNARDIEYNASNSKWQVDTVEEALNDLYTGTCDADVSTPIIKEGLIPVTLDDNGRVHYADTKSKWYNYCEKKWANAIILVESPSQEYKVGDIIKESDIESYFVWIPKYKYKLWNTGVASKKVHEIEIEFTTENTSDEEGISCQTPMTSGNIGNCNNGEWMTHPAFISLDVNGFWVGKFETGYKGANTIKEAEINSNDSTKIIVKPNVYSWRNNTVKNFFEASYNYKRKLDSHMIKNTEWGAVAYLSHSKYGIGYEININNNSSYKTGYSALPSTNQHTYPGEKGDGSDFNQLYTTTVGYLASTTGNITGIYDMNGGSHEYISSFIYNNYGLSGFDSTSFNKYNQKYFDIYTLFDNTTQLFILGDATMEMGPFKKYIDDDNMARLHGSWYENLSNFIKQTHPCYSRDGYNGDGGLSGIFSFAPVIGEEYPTIGTRITLSLKNRKEPI